MQEKGGKELGWCRRVLGGDAGGGDGGVKHYRTRGRRSDGTFLPVWFARDDPGGLRAEERRFAGATEVGPALLDLTLDLWQCDPRKQGPALSEPTESTDGSQLVKNNNKGQRKTLFLLTAFLCNGLLMKPLTTSTQTKACTSTIQANLLQNAFSSCRNWVTLLVMLH